MMSHSVILSLSKDRFCLPFLRASTPLRMAILITSMFALAACSSAATPDKISQIKPAMKPDQVEAILGQPTHIDHAETTGLQGDLYHYAAPNGEGRVVFLNEVVFKAEFIPGAKS